MRRIFVRAALCVIAAICLGTTAAAWAATPSGGFSLQVTPSPLVATIKPGQQSVLELKIHNANTAPEDLKMGLQSFSIDEQTGKIDLKNSLPDDVKSFVSFSDPTFHIEAGQWFTEKIIIDTPANAGFSYSFATIISRQNPAVATKGSSAIEGSVAVFTLLGVDRPGAIRKLDISEISSVKHVYEYLPAHLSLKLKNSGNTLLLPKGNIFISRTTNARTPLAVININPGNGYILPSTSRILENDWSDGFPSYQKTTKDDGSVGSKLMWNWSNLSQLRIGKYVAHVVAVYSDGVRDIPVEATVSFWVIPWKLLLGVALFAVLVIVGIVTTLRKSAKLVKRRGKSADASEK